MFKHILVPVDGSEFSQKAATYAAGFAQTMGARITALNVKPPHQLAQAGEGLLNDLLAPDKLEERVERMAQKCLQDVAQACQAVGVPCHTLAVEGDSPAQAILAAATSEGCDLVLMASHGRTGLERLIIGSETQKVLSHTALPVLVYR